MEVGDCISVRPSSGGAGLGAFASKNIKCGTLILSERPAIMVPKAGAPEPTCVECCVKTSFSDGEKCPECGLPFCQICRASEREAGRQHDLECKLLKSLGRRMEVNSEKDARKVHHLLGPLRMILLPEKRSEDSDPWLLMSHEEERRDTLVHFLNEANSVRVLRRIGSGLDPRLEDSERIHRACGILDTNSYEMVCPGAQARALYPRIARINHACAPNCHKFFTREGRRMKVMAARDIGEGEEITLSYVPTLVSTPIRQVLLQQTKYFTCRCPRCLDPTELGTNLSSLKCHDCKGGGGGLMPIDPLDLETDFQCPECGNHMSCDTAKALADTTMRFVDQMANSPEQTLEVMEHLKARFLSPSHHLLLEVRCRFVRQVIKEGEQVHLQKAFEFCSELLEVAKNIAPGRSTVRGMVSGYVHQLRDILEKTGGSNSCCDDIENLDLVLSREEVAEMFPDDKEEDGKENGSASNGEKSTSPGLK